MHAQQAFEAVEAAEAAEAAAAQPALQDKETQSLQAALQQLNASLSNTLRDYSVGGLQEFPADFPQQLLQRARLGAQLRRLQSLDDVRALYLPRREGETSPPQLSPCLRTAYAGASCSSPDCWVYYVPCTSFVPDSEGSQCSSKDEEDATAALLPEELDLACGQPVDFLDGHWHRQGGARAEAKPEVVRELSEPRALQHPARLKATGNAWPMHELPMHELFQLPTEPSDRPRASAMRRTTPCWSV